jgi:hypothetical protein
MNNMEFPKVKNISPTFIGNSIASVQPKIGPPPSKTYKDHMGNDVSEWEDGGRTIHSYTSDLLYGDYGHSFGRGFFVVDESGNMIFFGEKRYDEIVEKCRSYWKILKGIQENFQGYRVEPSRGERLSVNDKIIKEFSFYPGMLTKTTGEYIEEVIKFISEEIQRDIDRGRIIKGEYGAE